MAAYLDDERKEVLLEIVEYLNANYVHYGRAVAYLEQLAGVRAMPRNPATQLHVFFGPTSRDSTGSNCARQFGASHFAHNAGDFPPVSLTDHGGFGEKY